MIRILEEGYGKNENIAAFEDTICIVLSFDNKEPTEQ